MKTEKNYININLRLAEAIEDDDQENAFLLIQKLDNVELADFLVTASSEQRAKFFLKYLEYYTIVLIELPKGLKEEALKYLGLDKLIRLIQILEADDILDIVEDFDPDIREKIINALPKNRREVLTEVLSYPEESAGRLIHKDFVIVPESWTIGQAVDLLRTYKNIPQHFNEIFVVNEELQPTGSIKFRDLLSSKKNLLLRDIMGLGLKTIQVGLDQEEVANIFHDYGLLSAAVVDKEGKIVGVITIDDIVEVIKKEAEEDILHLSRVSENDVNATVYQIVSNRIPWLFITFVATNLSSLIIGLFSTTISKSIELAVLMPIIAAMGGNAGLQASTIAVQSIITKQLTAVNSRRLLIKELFVGLINGVIMGLCIVVVILIRFRNLYLEYTFLCAMIILFTLSTFLGTAVPIVLSRWGADPALSSSVITSSISDMLAFFILLSIATMFLL